MHMAVEQSASQDSELEREKSELFTQATEELAKSLLSCSPKMKNAGTLKTLDSERGFVYIVPTFDRKLIELLLRFE